MSNIPSYDTKWPVGSDKEFSITVPVDLSDYVGYAIHLVYAERSKAAVIDRYSLNTEASYLTKLETESTSETESVITMKGQRSTSELMDINQRIDAILFLQKTDADYLDGRKMEFQNPFPFCTAVKGIASAPDVS